MLKFGAGSKELVEGSSHSKKLLDHAKDNPVTHIYNLLQGAPAKITKGILKLVITVTRYKPLL